MNVTRITVLAAAAAAIGFSGCSTSTDTTAALNALLTDSSVTANAAATSSDAFVTTVNALYGNATTAGISAARADNNLASTMASVEPNVQRSRTCYDANNAVVAACSPFSSVRKVVTVVTIDYNRSGSSSTAGGATVTWTGGMHRSSTDTLTRLFSGTTDTAHVHYDIGSSNDTTTFTDPALTRLHTETSKDTVKNVVFRIPRSANPWPISGSIVRYTTIHVVLTKDGKTVTKDFTRTITITFPADNQGNVNFVINAGTTTKNCKLNLSTRAVTNCT